MFGCAGGGRRVAVYPDDGLAHAELIKHADRAMYLAKTRNGKAKSPPQDGRVALAALMRPAIERVSGGHVRSGCGARSALFVPMRSYSAMTWAPSSSNVAPISRLRSTTMAVVSDP